MARVTFDAPVSGLAPSGLAADGLVAADSVAIHVGAGPDLSFLPPEVSDALAYVELTRQPDLLVQMNESIITNAKGGLYDGCKRAIEIATARCKL